MVTLSLINQITNAISSNSSRGHSSLTTEIAIAASANSAAQSNPPENTPSSTETIKGGVQYVDSSIPLKLEGGVSMDNKLSDSVVDEKWAIDIAQSHHFTVQLSGVTKFQSPENTLGGVYLPVKSIQLTYSSYENMSIPVGIFGDFPLLNRKRVSTIQITCYDRDTDIIERELRNWESSCFPKNKFVAYLTNIVKEFTYKSFDVKGKLNTTVKMYVIPSGNLSVSRDYSNNDAKMLTFSLVCVGNGWSTQAGASKPRIQAKKFTEEVSKSTQSMVFIGNEGTVK